MINPLYCELLVEIDMDDSQLGQLVTGIINGKFEDVDSIVSSVLDISIDDNEFFNSPKYGEPYPPDDSPDRFFYYHYRIEIEPVSDDIPREIYIKEVANLLQGLWEHDCKAVAVCDFEDELPKQGGARLETLS